MRRVAYAFNSEAQLDSALKAGKLANLIDLATGFNRAGVAPVMYAKVTGLRTGTDGKRVKATQVQFDDSTNDWATITNPIIFDSDNIANDLTTTDIVSPTTLAVNEIVEVVAYWDNSEAQQWIAKPATICPKFALLKITASTNANTYTASIIDNETDATVLETGLTLKLLRHDVGTYPTGEVLYCQYDYKNSVYTPLNYAYWL